MPPSLNKGDNQSDDGNRRKLIIEEEEKEEVKRPLDQQIKTS